MFKQEYSHSLKFACGIVMMPVYQRLKAAAGVLNVIMGTQTNYPHYSESLDHYLIKYKLDENDMNHQVCHYAGDQQMFLKDSPVVVGEVTKVRVACKIIREMFSIGTGTDSRFRTIYNAFSNYNKFASLEDVKKSLNRLIVDWKTEHKLGMSTLNDKILRSSR